MDVKKVLICSLAYYPHVGGAEVALKEITDRITDIEFHMVTMRFSRKDALEEKIGNVVVHRVGNNASYLSKILFIPRAALRVRELHRMEKFDGAWAMMSYMALPLLYSGIPYALTLQEGDTERHMFGRLRILPFVPFMHLAFRKARALSAISTYLGGWARKRGYRGVVEIIPNGVDVKKFSGEKTPHEGTVLITASRLVYKNAIDDIIRTLPLLPMQVRLQILGDGPEKGALVSLAQTLNVLDRVEFLGFVDNAQVPKFLHSADIFVRPSRSEGMGNSFVEAFAAKIPVVATQEGGIADFLFDARRNPDKPTTGWAVDKNAPDQIALQIKGILGNPAQMEQVIANAYALVKEYYDWHLIAHAMRAKIFARLLH